MSSKTSNLLTPSELLDIYGVPVLNELQRREYFSLTAKEQKALTKLKSCDKAIYFLIALAFFKLKKTLVAFKYQDVTAERQHLMKRYFPKQNTPRTLPSSYTTKARIDNMVLKLCGYSRYSAENAKIIKKELQSIAPSKPKQRELLKVLLDLFVKHRVAIPGFTTLQDMARSVWGRENNRLIKAYLRYTSKTQRNKVLSLLSKSDYQYMITNIRRDMKGFRTYELQNEISKHKLIFDIFMMAKDVLPKLSLPTTTIEYYAGLIRHYTGARLKQLNSKLAQLYLICYCHTKYHHLNDNLLDALRKRTIDFQNAAKTFAKERALKQLDAVKEVRQKVSQMLLAIKQQPGHQVSKKMLYKHLPADEWVNAAILLADDKFDKELLYWQYIDSIQESIKLNLRPILLNVDFSTNHDSPLLNLVSKVKSLIEKKKFDNAVLPNELKRWIPKRTYNYIVCNGQIIQNRLEFLIYTQISNNLVTDKLSLKYTLKYKAVEDFCYHKPKWRKEKSSILKKPDQPMLRGPIKRTLEAKKHSLELLYQKLNSSILNGKNDGIKIVEHQDGSKTWRLRPIGAGSAENDEFFSRFMSHNIVDVLNFVNNKTNFIRCFDSIYPKSKKHTQDVANIMAILLANAIKIGSRKMAAISDLNESSLLTAEAAYIRNETVIAAINRVNEAAAKLPIYKKWYINSALHGSLDGIKVETSKRNFKSRYSSKYFGLGVGVSAYNEVVNSFSIASRIIGANEYEGHFAFEMVHHQNSSSIQPSKLSTDKHGTNALNHALFDLTGYDFSPRIPRPHREILWGFGKSASYRDYIVKPSRFLDGKHIKNEWDNIQRIVASLLTGEASPTHVIRKLSAQNYYSDTKKALAQYNQIVKTEYMLKYLLDPNLRNAVMKALNRGESYNRLYRAIGLLNKGELRGHSEVEMELWNQCTRLVSSVILYYNTYILNQVYHNVRDHSEKEYLTKLTPCSWGHINLMGYYQFSGIKDDRQLERWIKNWDWRRASRMVEF